MEQLRPLTDEIFLAFLSCRYKAYLKLAGASGEPSDYARLQQQLSAAYREAASAVWLAKRQKSAVIEAPASLPDTIAAGAPTIANAVVMDAGEICHVDGLERVPSLELQRGSTYSPVLFVARERPSANDQLLLAYGARVLGFAAPQDRPPIAHEK